MHIPRWNFCLIPGHASLRNAVFLREGKYLRPFLERNQWRRCKYGEERNFTRGESCGFGYFEANQEMALKKEIEVEIWDLVRWGIRDEA